MLPELSGEDVLPYIKGLPVIVMSTKTDIDNKGDLLLSGAVDYETKAGARKLPMTEDVARWFQTIIEDREKIRYERVMDGHTGFLFTDKEGYFPGDNALGTPL